MQTTWIIVADSSRARIFELGGAERKLREVEDLANAQGRADNRDLASDQDGRFAGGGARDAGHTAPPREDPVEHAAVLFARELGHRLEHARNEHRYQSLCMIAPPKFLGLLRGHLDKETLKLLRADMAKDVSGFAVKDIEDCVTQLALGPVA